MNNKNIDNKINLIKKIRNITGCGILACKNALIQSQGNVELAIVNMRKSGVAKFIKKDNISTNGIILSKIQNDNAAIIEINCQTDFTSKNILFQNFGKEILIKILEKKTSNINYINNYFEYKKNFLISKFGENINIRRISFLEGQQIGSYLHNMKIGVIISTKNMRKDLIKNIAMHITASKPEYISPEYIPAEKINEEKKIQLEIVKKYNKNSFISEKILENKIKNFIENISLHNQIFIFDTNKKVKQVLQEEKAKIISFIRFELGEGIEKNEFNFAKDVINMSNLYKK